MKTGQLAIVTAGVLLPGAARADDISLDFDRHADFTRFRTFAVRADAVTDNPLLDERILRNIEAQLIAKGLAKTTHNPDITIVAHMSFEKSQRAHVYNSGLYGGLYGWGYGVYGVGYGWGWGPTDVVIKDIVMGTLTIEMTNSATHAVVWRGTTGKRVHDESEPDDVDKRVQRSIEKVFRHFPPTEDDRD